jgi:dihydroneopterin aldolase
VTTIELYGLKLHGYHGVNEEERRVGQTFLFDLWLDLATPPEVDDIDQTVDYRLIASTVREVSGGKHYQLLESLAAAVADELLTRFPLAHARVRVRKPEVKLDPPVEFSAVTVTRP